MNKNISQIEGPRPGFSFYLEWEDYKANSASENGTNILSRMIKKENSGLDLGPDAS